MAAPFEAASPTRTFATATSRRARLLPGPSSAIVSAAPSAAAPRGAAFPRQGREVVLHRLELGDRPAKLDAVERPLHRLVEDVFESARHLLRPHRRPEPRQPRGVAPR